MLWAAGLGTLLITLVGVGLSSAFCLAPLGWLVMIILGCLGLGAVVLTRFGTMPYTPAAGPGQERGGPTSSESTSSEPEEALEPTDHTEGPASIELPEEPLEEPPEEPSEEPSEEAKETDVENRQE